MDVRRTLLMEALARRGWHVTARECNGLDWWADEIWTVESDWRPHGFTVFLTWLVDPDWGDYPGDGPGNKVWAVGTSLLHPDRYEQADRGPCLRIKHWPRDLEEFLDALDQLRDRGVNDRGKS